MSFLQLIFGTFITLHQHLGWQRSLLGLLLVLTGPILLRTLATTRPGTTVLGVAAVTLLYVSLGFPLTGVALALIAAVIHAVIRDQRIAAWLALAGLYLGWLALGWADLRPLGSALQELRWLGLAVLLAGFAELVDNRRQRISAMRRLYYEEQLRHQEEQQRKAGEERLRMARELHDVLAHSLSLITVRASVALELIDTHPEEVREALLAIKEASKSGLGEVRTVLSGLRADGDTAPRAPAPDLSRLDELREDAAAAGLAVTVTRSGRQVEVPAAVGLAGYRIVQEALTNVIRHSQAREAVVHLHFAESTVYLGVSDEGPARPVAETESGGGNGLVGIRERAAALGGTACAQSTVEGGFTVMVALPR